MDKLEKMNKHNKNNHFPSFSVRGIRTIFLIIYDFISIHTAYFLALWARFDFVLSEIPEEYLVIYRCTISLYAVICLFIFWFFKMYRSMWQFASSTEILHITTASMITSILHVVLILFMKDILPFTVHERMPIIYYIFGGIIQLLFVLIIRFIPRFLVYYHDKRKKHDETAGRIMLIGAGSAGQLILRDISHAKEIHDRVICIIDDDSDKWGRYLGNIPIVGGRDEILNAVRKYNINKIFLAIPTATAEQKRDILAICSETNCELKQLPGLYQLVLDEVFVSNMKDVSVEDLLGREPIRADLKEVFDFINGKVVLVTGGGGSIGSELCRQIAAHSPRQLIIFDVYENNAYSIQLELRESFPELDLVTLIGSVRDSRKMYDLFATYRPEIVYHAAAHKHVPLMEDSPCEAIKNNAIGTYKTAYAAMIHGCERFVLISTDKAVNPTNIMGASKRLCEMIIQSFDAKIKEGKAEEIPQLFTHAGFENADKTGDGSCYQGIRTEFVAVRFGNVLGSNGSVIPIFKKQIEKGGPITVTHPDIIRYFMTIPEAVSLVMLAGTYAHGGEIFVLDMGSPVKIDTLARNLIRLSGLRPDLDIKIEYTGLRPGEKLYEEKLMAEEGLKKTENEKIHIGVPIEFDVDMFLQRLDSLMKAAYSNKRNIRNLVSEIVTTYHPAGVFPSSDKTKTYYELIGEEDN